MRWPWVGMASFVAVLLVLALGHRWSVTASWFASDKTCGERHATPWFVERLGIDCELNAGAIALVMLPFAPPSSPHHEFQA
jgi:hypothetical protein